MTTPSQRPPALRPAELLECVINVSEGRDRATLAALAGAAGEALIDIHRDFDHHRSVLTLAGPRARLGRAARAVAATAVARIDLTGHTGAHPRFGALDVVPWVALAWSDDGRLIDADLDAARSARNEFAAWAGAELGLPCFLYGPERSLPAVRRESWVSLSPDCGPPAPHPTAGSVAVGARPLLVAYNLWLVDPDLDVARRVAAALRGPDVRALGLRVGESVQVSCNLIAPLRVGPGAAFDAVSSRAAVARAELVGLVPQAVLDAEPPFRRAELGLDLSATIEARLHQAGLDGGRFG